MQFGYQGENMWEPDEGASCDRPSVIGSERFAHQRNEKKIKIKSQISKYDYNCGVLFSRQGFLLPQLLCCQSASITPPPKKSPSGFKNHDVFFDRPHSKASMCHTESLNDLHSRVSDACLKEPCPAESKARLPSGAAVPP